MQTGLFRMRGRCGLLMFLFFFALGIFVTYYIWNLTKPAYPSNERANIIRKGNAPQNIFDMKQSRFRVGENNNRPELLRPPPKFPNNQDDNKRIPQRNPQILHPANDFRQEQKNVFQNPKKDKEYSEEEYEELPDEAATKKPNSVQIEKSQPDLVVDPLHMKPNPGLASRLQTMSKIVHLDLKGAIPKLSYLKEILPIIAKAGATGLLLEYEDSFPYSGDLSILRASASYTIQEITELLKLADQNNLEVIPLVPTFGHMEFVLKHEKYSALRETADTPQVITPSSPEAYKLIEDIISQVANLHPKSRFFHIGSDEVYELGKGRSELMMVKEGKSKHDIFLEHVKKVAGFIKAKLPQFQPIIWDDHLRSIAVETLKESGLNGYVEPMVWCYKPNVSNCLPKDLWKKYGQAFSNVWVASAFKGATGSTQYITNTSFHLQNHFSWLKVINENPDVHFRGIALTGWQRYDHFAALCELLPVAIPSLTACLVTLKRGGFSREDELQVGDYLRCSGEVELDMPVIKNGTAIISHDCFFPGNSLYYGARDLWDIWRIYLTDAGIQSRIDGWLSDYHIKRGYSNPGQLKVLNRKLSKTIDALTSLRKSLENEIVKYFSNQTADEWLDLNVDQNVRKLREILAKSYGLLQMQRGFANRNNVVPPKADVLPSNNGMEGSLGQNQNAVPRRDSGNSPLFWPNGNPARGNMGQFNVQIPGRGVPSQNKNKYANGQIAINPGSAGNFQPKMARSFGVQNGGVRIEEPQTGSLDAQPQARNPLVNKQFSPQPLVGNWLVGKPDQQANPQPQIRNPVFNKLDKAHPEEAYRRSRG